MTREQYLERAVECVSYAKAHGLFVSYSAEDSTRTDLNFLKKVFRTVAEAGVDRLRVVDTLGAITPTAMKYLISEVKKEVPRKPVEVHCHNDHGLAVANSLSAVEAGASVISSSVNGLGERCGLAATEQVIIGLHNLYGYNLWKLEEIYSLCKLVESLTGVPIQPSAPVVGEDAFSHKAGIHQHGILQSVSTYEPYPPEMVGRKRTIILGKLSGHHAVKMKLQQIGVNASDDVIFKILDRVKSLSEEKNRSITEEEFQKIVREVMKS
jgi:2-isopropylmalate synthase